MGSLADYLENELLDHVFGVGAFSVPSNIYVGLSTADPGDDAAGLAEPSGNNYARVQVNAWDEAAARATANTGVITFPQASGAWGTITHFAIFDAASAGNMLAHGALATSKAVVSGNTPSIGAGEIDVSFNAGAIGTYLANELLDHVFKVGSYSPPTIYVGLSTANPGDDASGLAEPSGNNYARKDHSAWNTASGGATSNDGDITFATPSGSWGEITYQVIMDAATDGNLLFYSTATPNQTPDDGDTVKFPDEDLDVSMS